MVCISRGNYTSRKANLSGLIHYVKLLSGEIFMTDDRMLEEAINAINNGQKVRAKELLSRLLRSDQKNITYWLYMSTVVETEKERIYCLNNAKNIDPDNEIVRRGLIYYGEESPSDDYKHVYPERTREWDIAKVIQSTKQSKNSKGSGKNKPKLGAKRIASFAIYGILGASLLVFALFNGKNLLSNNIEITRRVLQTAGPASTLRPTATPFGAEPSATPITSIILGEILNVVFTPTAPVVPHPTDSNEALQTAMRHFINGYYDEALPLFKQFIDAFPENVDARYYYAQTFFQMGEYQKSVAEFSKIINIDDKYGPGYLGYAQARLAFLPSSKVGEELQYAVNYMPDIIDPYLVQGAYFLDRENLEGAITNAETALEIDPGNAMANQILVDAYLRLEEYQLALQPARNSIAGNPTIIDNYLPFGVILVENKQFAEAEEPLKAYLALNEEDITAWFYLGRVKQALGLHEEAISFFDTVLSLDLNYYLTSYYLGVSYLALEDYENAIDRLQNARRIYPLWYEPAINYAEALFRYGDIAEANFTLEKISPMAKTNYQLAQLYYWRAQSFELLDYNDLADEDWQNLLDLPFEDVPPAWSQSATQYLSGLSATETPSSTPLPTKTLVPSRTPSPTP
jgi:tetratricopeptide (TPR) repeat protein